MLLVVFLVACQTQPVENKPKNLTFKGRSEIWSAELKTNKLEKELILKYKEKESIPSNIEFKLNAPNWAWGMGEIKLNTGGVGVYTIKENESSDLTAVTDKIKVEVKWNDKVDTFTNQNK